MPHCDHRHPIHPSNLGHVNLGFTNNHTLQVWNTICMAEWLWRPRTHLISALTRSQSLPQCPERTRYDLTDGNWPLQVKWISKTDHCRWIWEIVRDGLGGLVCWTSIIHTIMYLTCYLIYHLVNLTSCSLCATHKPWKTPLKCQLWIWS